MYYVDFWKIYADTSFKISRFTKISRSLSITLGMQYTTLFHPIRILLNIFPPLGHRLNATVHKKLHAWHDVDCVVRCLDDTCCRSVNYLKTLDFDKEDDDNKDNCELLHDAAGSAKNSSLLRNDDYDYFILKNHEKVSIYSI